MSGETTARPAEISRTAGSNAGRASTRTSGIPNASSWPSSRESSVPPSHGSSAAAAPEVAGALTTTIAVVTAVGSAHGRARWRGAPGLTAVVSVVTPLVKAGGD